MSHGREATRTLSEDLFCLRGMSILLVVIVHVLGVDAAHGVRKLFPEGWAGLRLPVEFIHSFNMAVMLMGSGVAVAAFGRMDCTLGEFARKKLNKLVVPMLLWAPVLLVTQRLTKGVPQGAEGWLDLASRIPNAWFPPYSIFWFVHVLVWCTLLAWALRKFAGPMLGRWTGLVSVGLALLLHLGVKSWRAYTGAASGDYVEFVLYWNRFFSLGLFLYPWLGPARAFLARLPVALLALVPVGAFSLIALVQWVLPVGFYKEGRLLIGPLGFSALLALAVLLRTVSGSRLRRQASAGLLFIGAESMHFYLFHIYFVSGTRILLERLNPGTPLAVHLVLGCLAGLLGPWLLLRATRERRSVQWSTRLSGLPTR